MLPPTSGVCRSRPSSATHLPVNPLPHQIRQFSSHSSSAFDDFNSSECSSAASANLGKAPSGYQRSSWTNLVDFGENWRTAKVKLAKDPLPEAPPPYEQLQPSGQPQLTACRQNSNASAGTHSSGPFSVSKGSSTYFHFSGQAHPPFPLLAGPQARPHSGGARSGSAQSSAAGQGGRLSSGTGSSRRELQPRGKRDRMQELRELWARPGCRLCCLIILLLLIGLIAGIIVLSSHLALPQHLDFAWFAPEQLRSTPSTAIGQPSAVNIGRLDVGKMGQQVRLELNGAQPFRSNFISVLDFKSNQVAILDLALRSGQRNSICFVMDLDRQNIPDMEALLRAAVNGAESTGQLHGWEESWQWTPQLLSQAPVFQPEVAECKGARWVQLSRTGTDQKGEKCSECFDFCLPDWGIDRDAIRNQQHLNILRRICFSLFVPEWRPFAQSLGWQQNQHDFEQFYRQQQQQGAQSLLQQQVERGRGQAPVGGGGGGAGQQAQTGMSGQNGETRWISLQVPPAQQSAGTFPSFPASSSAVGQPGQWNPPPPQGQQPSLAQYTSWPWGQVKPDAGGGGTWMPAGHQPQMPSQAESGPGQWPQQQQQQQGQHQVWLRR